MRIFGLGLLGRAQRALGIEPPPPPETLTPVAQLAAAEPDPDRWYKTAAQLDLPALAEAAPTRFERIYYGHAGRRIFKWRHYLPIYDRVLAPYVGRPLTVVEVGVAAGGSLELWREFLGPQIRLVGVDIDPNCQAFAGPGVEIMIGSQADPDFLSQLAERTGPIDIVIDDGSHICSHQITTMEALFPHVRPGGLYICEDLHSSYWETYEGGLKAPGSYIEYVKDLIDRVHAPYYGHTLEPDDMARSVEWMTLADSVAVFAKGSPTDTYMVEVGG